MNVFRIFCFAVTLLLVFSCSKSTSGTDDDNGPSITDKKANLLATGDSANDILSNTNFDKMVIEIGYVTGFRPATGTMEAFTDYLRRHTFKEDIELIYTELDSPVEDELTLKEISDLELKNRTAFNVDRTLAIYIYFADAPGEGDDLENGLVTLGAVYRNTSMIIHEATIRKLAARSFLITDQDIETATLNHEFGHLFGLVDIGTDMVNDHESQSENDEGELEGNNHCNQAGCLMRAELQFSGSVSGKSKRAYALQQYEGGIKAGCAVSGATVLNLLHQKTARGIGSAIDLDPECVLDIRANVGGSG